MRLSVFLNMIKSGDIEAVKEVIQEIPRHKPKQSKKTTLATLRSINSVNKNGRNPLDTAIIYTPDNSKYEMIELLLNNGANSNIDALSRVLLKLDNKDIYELFVDKYGIEKMSINSMEAEEMYPEFFESVLYYLKHEEITNKKRVSILSYLILEIKYDDFILIYNLCDDISVENNFLALKANLLNDKGDGKKIKGVVFKDKNVIATAVRLDQTSIIPEELKDMFIF